MSTFLCWSAFFLTLTNIDPFATDKAGIGSFFVSLFLGLMGLIILILMYIRSRFYSVAELYEKMPMIVRQSVFISMGITAILGMQAMRVLTWWTGLMLILILVLLEISFYTNIYNYESLVKVEENEEISNF